jgi:hypothetical protein
VIDADFECPFEVPPAGFLRLIYFISDCYYCDKPSLYGVTFNSRGVSGIYLLTHAIEHSRDTITAQMQMDGDIDDEILSKIRKELRTAWLCHNPDPI